MSLIDRIKRLLGVADDDDDASGAVTIEREPERETAPPATETEAAVKGTDAGAAAPADEPVETDETSGDDATTDDDTTDTADTTTDDDTTDTTTDDAAADDTAADVDETAAEPRDDEAAAGGDSPETVADDTEETADDTEETADDATDTTNDTAEPEDVPVAEIRGIGPAYSDRLADAGVETVAELAATDAETVASATELSEKRVSTWIQRAADHGAT